MRKIKYLFFINLLILLFYTLKKETFTYGEIWRNIHVNSLIGLQKLLESSYIQSKIEISIWHGIFLPILQLPVLITLSLILTVIFIILVVKY
jgi:hypothetical protein